jgi:hypothetical protein
MEEQKPTLNYGQPPSAAPRAVWPLVVAILVVTLAMFATTIYFFGW